MSTTSEQAEPPAIASRQQRLSAPAGIVILAILPVLALLFFCSLTAKLDGNSLFRQVWHFVSSVEGIRYVVVTQLDLFAVVYFILTRGLAYISKPRVYLLVVFCLLTYPVVAAYLMYCRGMGAFDRLFFLIPWKDWVF
jgi:hypothetical protein